MALAAGLLAVYDPGPMRKNKPVICTTLTIEVLGPQDASAKRIRFVQDTRSRLVQQAGVSLGTCAYPQCPVQNTRAPSGTLFARTP